MALTVILTMTLTVTITMRVSNPIYVACRVAQTISVVFLQVPGRSLGMEQPQTPPATQRDPPISPGSPLTQETLADSFMCDRCTEIFYTRGPPDMRKNISSFKKCVSCGKLSCETCQKPFKQPQREGCYEYIGNLCSLQGIHVLLAGVSRDSRGRQCMHHMFSSHDPGLSKDP